MNAGAINVPLVFLHNRLYIKIVGFPRGATEFAEAFAKNGVGLGKLKPGRALVSDVSESKAVTPETAQVLEQILEQYKSYGVGRIVRIVGHEMITNIQYPRITHQADIPADNVGTAEKAEELLRRLHL